jgi:diketogulonate reductase-like aldo/keto reductase
LGACFIDRAEFYDTEEVIGQAVKGIRKDIFLAHRQVCPSLIKKELKRHERKRE